MKNLRRFAFLCGILASLFSHQSFTRSWLAKHDPYPLYQSVYDLYMTKWKKEKIKEIRPVSMCEPHLSFAVSPFIQTASSGKTFGGDPANLSVLQGEWNMLGLLYGPRPVGTSLDGTQLGNAKQFIFADINRLDPVVANPATPTTTRIQPNTIIPGCILPSTTTPTCSDEFLLTDQSEQVGFFSIPTKYKNLGVRFEFSFQPFDGIGLTVQGGVAEYRQTTGTFLNRTTDAQGTTPHIYSPAFDKQIPLYPSTLACIGNNPCTTPIAQIQAQLMNPAMAQKIFSELGYDSCNFERTSFEDINLYAWTRHVFPFLQGKNSWPTVLIIPSLAGNITLPIGTTRNWRQLFGLGFGNNGHFAVGADAGVSVDFAETVEIGFLVGATYFLSKTVKEYPLPNYSYQSGIYPFFPQSPVNVKPGNNFNFNAYVHAYHFVDHLSAHAEYVMVKHESDKLTIEGPNKVDPAFECGTSGSSSCDLQKEIFLPEQAACLTKFTSSFINAGLNYDITPNITLGFIAQFPVKQRNSYASTTWMGSLRILY